MGADSAIATQGVSKRYADMLAVDALDPEIARILIGAGIALTELAPTREDLESYFLRLTGGVK